jgi:hypothetical protein
LSRSYIFSMCSSTEYMWCTDSVGSVTPSCADSGLGQIGNRVLNARDVFLHLVVARAARAAVSLMLCALGMPGFFLRVCAINLIVLSRRGILLALDRLSCSRWYAVLDSSHALPDALSSLSVSRQPSVRSLFSS